MWLRMLTFFAAAASATTTTRVPPCTRSDACEVCLGPTSDQASPTRLRIWRWATGSAPMLPPMWVSILGAICNAKLQWGQVIRELLARPEHALYRQRRTPPAQDHKAAGVPGAPPEIICRPGRTALPISSEFAATRGAASLRRCRQHSQRRSTCGCKLFGSALQDHKLLCERIRPAPQLTCDASDEPNRGRPCAGPCALAKSWCQSGSKIIPGFLLTLIFSCRLDAASDARTWDVPVAPALQGTPAIHKLHSCRRASHSKHHFLFLC